MVTCFDIPKLARIAKKLNNAPQKRITFLVLYSGTHLLRHMGKTIMIIRIATSGSEIQSCSFRNKSPSFLNSFGHIVWSIKNAVARCAITTTRSNPTQYAKNHQRFRGPMGSGISLDRMASFFECCSSMVLILHNFCLTRKALSGTY